MLRLILAAWLVAVFAIPARSQMVQLGETVSVGEFHKYEIDLAIGGHLKVDRNGKPDNLSIHAKAKHRFAERIEAIDSRGGAGKVIRHYDVAQSNSTIANEKASRELGADRRLTFHGRTESGTLHYSPLGALSREELELVAEHFDTLVLAGLLPNKAINVGETWKLGDDAVQHACQFEGLTKNKLMGTLVSADGTLAKFNIGGQAEGVEAGAATTATVKASGVFDIKSGRITELTWEQFDERGQGPASPAAELTAVVVLKRSVLAEEPKELAIAVREKVPTGKVPAELLQLRYTDADGKYSFQYPREWIVVGRTNEHLVIRLIEKAEFVAQVTISSWKRAEAGQHATAEEFKTNIAKLPGWESTGTLEEGPVPAPAGHWLYRVAAKGKQEGSEVFQTFYLLAGPNGDQVAMTVLASPEKGGKTSAREGQLLGAIVFPAAKK